jgi:tripeptidyl-peptidase-1
MDVSHPSHPSYGVHLGRLELRDMIAHAKESFESVLALLESQGIVEKSAVENDWIIVDGTIGNAEKLLQTEYQFYENTETRKLTARTLEYSLPVNLHAHVDIVAPTIKFSTPAAKRSTIVKGFEAPTLPVIASSASDIHDGLNVTACNVTITPDCIKALYKLNHFRGSRCNGNQLALAGFLDEYAQHADLAQFLATYGDEAVDSDFDTVLINGGLNTQNNASDSDQSIVEANLDIQYGPSISYPKPTTYLSTGGFPPEIRTTKSTMSLTSNSSPTFSPWTRFLKQFPSHTEMRNGLSKKLMLTQSATSLPR